MGLRAFLKDLASGDMPRNEFSDKVFDNRARNDAFCPDGQCTPGARGQQLTGWNADSDRAMGQLRQGQQVHGEGRMFGRSALEGMHVTQEMIDARFPDNRPAHMRPVDNWRRALPEGDKPTEVEVNVNGEWVKVRR